MHAFRWLLVCALASLAIACGDDGNNNPSGIQCSDDVDNDGDGDTDFPDDIGCAGADDETEDSSASPQCKDGRDNDGDGKRDFPNDPGCFAPQQDSETDDCPDGATCPQCSDGKDNDNNGQTDFPADSGGCMAASDSDEYTQDLAACGAGVTIKKLPFDGKAQGILMAGAQSKMSSMMCGGIGTEEIFEIRVIAPKVIVASTNNDLSMADTVIYLRSAMCTDPAMELNCNDNVDLTDKQSAFAEAVDPGTYYLIVDSKDSLGGMYDLSVSFQTGAGESCGGPSDCGPGLICRIPKGMTDKICSKHVCDDAVDEDDDGKAAFPNDPGCTSSDDDDEADPCPGSGCPECADMIDNDLDNMTDFGADTTCTSASSASEACPVTDGVTVITTASTAGTLAGATNDGKPSCASTTSTVLVPDRMYRLNLPAMQTLTIENVNTFSGAMALFNSSCLAPSIACSALASPEKVVATNLVAGPYYYTVDGYSSIPTTPTYTINVSGTIQNGAPCDGVLATAGAITCGIGYACQGGTCQAAACFDGIDNEATPDGKIDYPFDQGCSSPADTTEANPATAPICADGTDNDGDGATDYPADFGCEAASGGAEKFCMPETDAASSVKITTKTTTGTTAGKANDHAGTCVGASSTNAPDVALGLQLPVPVATLVIDTEMSLFDTILIVKNVTCTTQLACDDEGGVGTNTSKVTMTGVAPGAYAVIVDGWSTQNGAFTLNVQGTVAPGTQCSSPLFSGGAAAVLLCPAGTTCTGTPARCQ